MTGEEVPSPQEFRRALYVAMHESLAPSLGWLAVVFLLLVVTAAGFLPSPARWILAASSALEAAGVAWLRQRVLRGAIGIEWAPHVQALMVGAILARLAPAAWVDPNVYEPMMLVLLIVGIGFLCLDTYWAAGLMASCLATWTVVIATSAGHTLTVDGFVFLVLGVTMGASIHASRLRAIWRIEMHRLREAKRRALHQETQELLSAILHTAPGYIMTIDPDGTILYVNRPVGGVSPDALLGTSCYALMRPPDRERVRTACVGALTEDETRELEIRGPDADGAHTHFRVRIGPLHHGGGVSGLTMLAADVTALKRAERRLQQLNDELELRVASRTAALEEANRDLESFAYTASHDLRTPLRAINGFSQLIEEAADELSDTTRDHVRRIRHASVKLSEMLDGLLQLSRVARRELELQPVDLTALARDVAEQLQRSRPQRTVAWTIAEGVTAVGDPNLLRVLVQNLLENAWKYSAARPTAHIELGCLADTDPPTYFVRDDGVGFDMRFVDKLFRPFQRLHDDQATGMGIGLATVDRVVRRHGGRAWAEGRTGAGATFYFTLGGGSDDRERASQPAASAGTGSP